MNRGMRIGGVVLAVVIGMLVAGCGGDDTPEDVVETFFTATSDGDAEGICNSITEAAATQAAEDEDAESCEEGVEKSLASEDSAEDLAALEGAEVGEATIDGETATVAITSAEGEEGEVPVVQEDGEWKVDLGD